VLAVIGEARHRRSWIHDVVTGTHTRCLSQQHHSHDRAGIRVGASADATQVAIVAERDGDTVTPHRHLWRVDLSREVTVREVRDRLTSMRTAEWRCAPKERVALRQSPSAVRARSLT
jgi:hypothetical protein